MVESSPPYDGQEAKAEPTSVSLYEQDKRDVERIRDHFKLDSFSQALRRCIREAVDSMDKERAA